MSEMSNNKINIKIYQSNFTVGDIFNNSNRIKEYYLEELNKSSNLPHLIVFPELSLSGYDPQDLLLREKFIKDIEKEIEDIISLTKYEDNFKKPAILLTAPVKTINNKIYNSILFIENNRIKNIAYKNYLANYSIFDENRYFDQGSNITYININNYKIALLICRDLWHDNIKFLLQEAEIDIIITVNASCFTYNKEKERIKLIKDIVTNSKANLIYLNQISGQDGNIFDGNSLVMNKDFDIIHKLQDFEEDISLVKFVNNDIINNYNPISYQDYIEKINLDNYKYNNIYNSLILGVRDYFKKNNFQKAIISISGGIDSAITALITADAIGSDNLYLIALNNKFNKKESLEDALDLANNLNNKLNIIHINDIYESYLQLLNLSESEIKDKNTIENLQARIRANIVMAISNKNNFLVMATSNKSEIAVGYQTIYGDSCGAINPIKDIYKSEIYKLAEFRNNNITKLSIFNKKNIINNNIMTKEPSAELSYDQKDSHSLPKYDILDKILFQFIELRKSEDEIIQLGYDKNIVNKIIRLVKNSEYKRRQIPIGIKISDLSFDNDFRYPITNLYKFK